ncbi:hypothetical protein PN36_00045 [Candidatus Thiomargarita nelsonii]|uniref:Type II toxin-antitoxin system HicA family toxin n=1 Tax=Candidatus Thiomargarita nelsonii TaxID=1003181 RepID=A0A0A6PJ99_9GAMM|nr:hypothetical protein PN36_00045 [Candidatus Thiomargarita nelsonii]
MYEQISYDLIKKVLVKQLGFEIFEVPGSHYVFTHKQTGTIFPLPIFPNQKNLALTHHYMIHNILDKSGVMDGEAFEALLKTLQKQEKYNNEPVATSLNFAKAA